VNSKYFRKRKERKRGKERKEKEAIRKINKIVYMFQQSYFNLSLDVLPPYIVVGRYHIIYGGQKREGDSCKTCWNFVGLLPRPLL